MANIQEIIKEKKKAPYYLNSIFDQLKTEEDYDKFYSSIADNAKVVFTLPAYVTGLLLYYSGMLIGKLSRITILTILLGLIFYRLVKVVAYSTGSVMLLVTVPLWDIINHVSMLVLNV